MDARSMQIEFERRLTLMNPELANSEKPDSDTIFSFLYAYSLRFVQQHYLAEDNAEDDTRVQKYGKDLISSLLTKSVLPCKKDSTETNCYTCELPKDYFLYVRSSSQVKLAYSTSVQAKVVPNKLVSEETINEVLTAAWNTIILPLPYVSINTSNASNGSKFELVVDSYTTPSSVSLVYYRKPKKFNVIGVDNKNVLNICELPESTHMAIVEGAVDMFIVENKYRLSSNSKQDKQ